MHSVSDAPAGYGVEDISWHVEVFEGQEPITLSGTVQEIYSQVLQRNPNFKLKPNSSRKERRETDLGLSLNKRWALTDQYCGIFSNAYCGAIAAGVNYFYGVPGSPINGPGPGNCGRASCSYGSGIWWCNNVCTAPFSIDVVLREALIGEPEPRDMDAE